MQGWETGDAGESGDGSFEANPWLPWRLRTLFEGVFSVKNLASCYTAAMWPFKKNVKESAGKRGGKMMKRVIVGFVIGGAISSIIGQKLLHKNEEDVDEDEAGE